MKMNHLRSMSVILVTTKKIYLGIKRMAFGPEALNGSLILDVEGMTGSPELFGEDTDKAGA